MSYHTTKPKFGRLIKKYPQVIENQQKHEELNYKDLKKEN